MQNYKFGNWAVINWRGLHKMQRAERMAHSVKNLKGLTKAFQRFALCPMRYAFAFTIAGNDIARNVGHTESQRKTARQAQNRKSTLKLRSQNSANHTGGSPR